jgi:hypothetical protein
LDSATQVQGVTFPICDMRVVPLKGVPLVVIQRQLRPANLGITSIYLQGIDSSEIIATVCSRG